MTHGQCDAKPTVTFLASVHHRPTTDCTCIAKKWRGTTKIIFSTTVHLTCSLPPHLFIPAPLPPFYQFCLVTEVTFPQNANCYLWTVDSKIEW